MFRHLTLVVAIAMISGSLFLTAFVAKDVSGEIREIVPEDIVPVAEVAEIPMFPEPETKLSEEDICLIAHLTMAEAEGESEYGKRLVISTVLNRMDSKYFPDTVKDVVYQKNQFSSVWNGRWDRCCADIDICDLVKAELTERSNYDVIFFTAGRYGEYGSPMFREGNHYFSKYE